MYILLLSFLAVAAVSADECETVCANCPVVERSQCLAGMQKDNVCGCCDVCSKFEGQKCDMKDTPFKHGRCGDGLECKDTAGGSICQCVWENMVCGSDGKSYYNLCQLMAAAVREGLQDSLEVASMGPCEKAAKIVSKPQYIKNNTNENVVLSCEAVGSPAPTIKWEVTRANGETFEMPGDDDHILIASRGGPAKYQATSWVQIEGLMKRHEGDYDCIAFNTAGEDRAKARVKVVN